MKYTPPQLYQLYPECPTCTSGSTPAGHDVACYSGGLGDGVPLQEVDEGSR